MSNIKNEYENLLIVLKSNKVDDTKTYTENFNISGKPIRPLNKYINKKLIFERNEEDEEKKQYTNAAIAFNKRTDEAKTNLINYFKENSLEPPPLLEFIEEPEQSSEGGRRRRRKSRRRRRKSMKKSRKSRKGRKSRRKAAKKSRKTRRRRRR